MGGLSEARTSATATVGAATALAVAPGTEPTRAVARATHRPGRKVGSVVVLAGGDLVLYVERGGRSLISFGDDSETSARRLALACAELARASRAGLLGKMVIGRIDGIDALAGAGSTASRAFGVTAALMEAGFRPTPRGLRA
ncbi:putative ATP-dependent helicase Lhr [Oerskovia enterophila]|uniref:ATP-dependent helicase Lhr n=1 Tax=Oerskovia enterophila TaxID=43678 RepID=A0ABX2XY93_9CELL|nr:putative ATP-dependent helicase Lhr [Oerskovia enterophila]